MDLSSNIDISVVITAHQEGRLAHPAHMSAHVAMQKAKEQNITSELIILLDRADDATRTYFQHYQYSATKLLEVNYGDPGLARNLGVQLARGRTLAFLDADDLWGDEWLTLAFSYLNSSSHTTICHPQLSQVFGERTETIIHPDQTDPDFSVTELLIENPWTVSVLAHRFVFEKNPFPATRPESGIGYEDWSWQCNTLAEGFVHRIVPDTIHFIRSKKNSQNARNRRNSYSFLPSTKFCDLIRKQLKDG